MSKTFVSILAGLGGMFGWGISDFFANNSSEKIGHTKTFFWSQLCGLFVIGLVALLTFPAFDFPIRLTPLLLFGVIGYVVGLLFYYKSFEVGNLSVVAVVINLNAVFTMIVAYFVFGQRLTGYQIPAVALIIIGVTLVSVNFKEIFGKQKISLMAGVKEALIASAGFGIIHWPITEYIVERSNWLWNALIVRVLALSGVILFTVFKKESLKLKRNALGVAPIIIATGILESLAILSVNYGFNVGDSILVSPIANSVAVVTVTLAVVFLKEKISKTQGIGILMTLLGIILTAF